MKYLVSILFFFQVGSACAQINWSVFASGEDVFQVIDNRFYNVGVMAESNGHQFGLGFGGNQQNRVLDKDAKRVFQFTFNNNPIDSIINGNPFSDNRIQVNLSYAKEIIVHHKHRTMIGLGLFYSESNQKTDGTGTVTQNNPPDQVLTVFDWDIKQKQQRYGIQPLLIYQYQFSPIASLRIQTAWQVAFTQNSKKETSKSVQTFRGNPNQTIVNDVNNVTKGYDLYFTPVTQIGFVLNLNNPSTP